MERVRYVTHKGARILEVDISYTRSVEENIDALHQATKLVGAWPPKSLLILTNVTKAHFNLKGVEEIKRFSAFNTPFVKASAVLGVDGIYRIIYEAIIKLTGRDIVCFDTEEQALDWLATQ